jgi:two-component system phosphate regulon response regulator PhoB
MTPSLIIAEDDEPLLDLLRYNVAKAGYTAETVRTGDEAEKRLNEFVPNLLLLDWMLPCLSGVELCWRLRQKVRTKSLPIIMLTARAEEAEGFAGSKVEPMTLSPNRSR